KVLAPLEIRLATPLRSYSREGTAAVPVMVTREVELSILTSSVVAMPSANFSATVKLVKGVDPLRKLPAPDSGRRSRAFGNYWILKPEIAPSWPVSVAVPSSDCIRPNGLDPDATTDTLRLPRPDSRLMPNSSLAQACRSTSRNWNCALTSAMESERATANEPL